MPGRRGGGGASAGPKVADEVCAGLDTVAIRMPSHPVARAVIAASGLPLAAPSANRSGGPSPTIAEDVMADMDGRLPLILDGGACGVGVESTVITLAGEQPMLLRPGFVTKEQLEQVLGCEVQLAGAVLHKLKEGETARSPGMKYKHYAPKAHVTILRGDFEAYRKYVCDHAGSGVWALCFDGEGEQLPVPFISYGAKEDDAAQARELFRIAKDKRLLLTEAMWTRYLPMRGTINEVLRSGIVGKPWLLTANLGYMISDVERLKEPSLAGGALLDVGVYPLNFAAMVFGNDPVSIQGSAVLSDKGVDRQDSITLRYADGRMAVLNATMMGMSDRRGVIDCDNGMLEIVNINCPQELRVYNRERVLIASYRAPKCITGYEYEVEACIRALDAGGIECPLMPHAETVRMMEWMDGLRAQFGVRYPEEIEKL